MQCVILAGGLGTRLKNLTQNCPKPLVDINGRPFLHYILNLLKSYGFKNYIFLTGYLADMIEKYFGSGKEFGVSIKYSREEKPMGTGGAIKLAEDYLDSKFMLINGDTFLDTNYITLTKIFKKKRAKGLVIVSDNHKYKDRFNISMDKQGIITNYNKQSVCSNEFVDSGIYFFKKKVLELIPENRKVSLEKEIFIKLIKNNALYGYCIEDDFIDIGTFQGLRAFKNRVATNTKN